jgi:hypothetical protein
MKVVLPNQIAHTPVGIELDADVEGAVITQHTSEDVKESLRLHDPEQALVLKASSLIPKVH